MQRTFKISAPASARFSITHEQRKERQRARFEAAFWDALGHGMSEEEADAYANRKIANA